MNSRAGDSDIKDATRDMPSSASAADEQGITGESVGMIARLKKVAEDFFKTVASIGLKAAAGPVLTPLLENAMGNPMLGDARDGARLGGSRTPLPTQVAMWQLAPWILEGAVGSGEAAAGATAGEGALIGGGLVGLRSAFWTGATPT